VAKARTERFASAAEIIAAAGALVASMADQPQSSAA
jgi:hypothetical protein